MLASPSLAGPTVSHDGVVADPPKTGEWRMISECLLFLAGGGGRRRFLTAGRQGSHWFSQVSSILAGGLGLPLYLFPVVNDVGPLTVAH